MSYVQVRTDVAPQGVKPAADPTVVIPKSEVSRVRWVHVCALVGLLAGTLFLWAAADGKKDSPRGIVFWPVEAELEPRVKEQNRYPKSVIAFVTLTISICIKGFYLFSTQRDDSSISSDLVQRYWPRTCFEATAINVFAYSMLADACLERDFTKQVMIVTLVVCGNIFQWMAESFSRMELNGVELQSAKIMLAFSLVPFTIAWAILFAQLGLSREALDLGSSWGKWRLQMPVIYLLGEISLLVCTATRVYNSGQEATRVCVQISFRAITLLLLCITVGMS
jgi:hypothetical protein